MKKIYISFFLLLISNLVFAQLRKQPAKGHQGKKQAMAVILMNGTAHLGNGKTIKNSVVAFENGKITIVADATRIRLDLSKFKKIDVSGKHIYHGLAGKHNSGRGNNASVKSPGGNKGMPHLAVGQVANILVSDGKLADMKIKEFSKIFVSGIEKSTSTAPKVIVKDKHKGKHLKGNKKSVGGLKKAKKH